MSKTGITQVSLRLSDDVYEMLKAKADENGRSLNSEAIQAIIEHCDADSLAARIEKIERHLFTQETPSHAENRNQPNQS